VESDPDDADDDPEEDFVLAGDPDADITGLVDAPADACVDADAEDSTEPEEPDVESDPDDADDDPEEDFVLAGDPDADVAELVDAPADACVDADAEDSTEPEEPDVESDADELVDDPEGEDEQPESDVSAHATPCPVTTAAPTPKATASPPTRPTYAAAFNSFLLFGTFEGMVQTGSRLLISVTKRSPTDHRQITDRSQDLTIVCAGHPVIR